MNAKSNWKSEKWKEKEQCYAFVITIRADIATTDLLLWKTNLIKKKKGKALVPLPSL